MIKYWKKSVKLWNTNTPLVGQRKKMAGVLRRFEYMTVCTWSRIKGRIKWRREFIRRHREPMYAYRGHSRMIIFPRDIVDIFGVHLRTAQRMMRDARFLLGKRKMAYITVKEFSVLNELNEEWLLCAIDAIDAKLNIFEDTGEEESRNNAKKRKKKGIKDKHKYLESKAWQKRMDEKMKKFEEEEEKKKTGS